MITNQNNHDADSFARMKKILKQIMQSPADLRESILTEHAKHEPELIAEVRQLISIDPGTDFLKPAVELRQSTSYSIAAQIGRKFGNYRVVKWIASGGMGDVYEALEADTTIIHRVALKIVRNHLRGAIVVEKLKAERELLNRLHHPNIVKLIDFGIADDEIPYLVMEYVEGMSLTDFCDANRLTITERIILFVNVCNAVHYAHQNLIVHCDLKPSNVLVSSKGEIKLLDFGIAEHVDAESENPSGSPLSSVEAMTHQYSSPEQRACGPITTASDIYSLGMILFTLLVGAHPNKLIADVKEGENESTAPFTGYASSYVGKLSVDWRCIVSLRSVGLKRLRDSLKGDLDTILRVCLNPEPSKRYESARHLAADLERHLCSLPVSVRRQTIFYKAGRFVRRNRVAAVAIALAVASLFGVALSTSIGMSRLRAEWSKAKATRATTQQTLDFFANLLTNARLGDNDGGERVLEIVHTAENRLAADPPSDPIIEAAIRTTLGQSLLNLSRCEDAKKQLNRVIELRRGLISDQSFEIARTTSLLGAAQWCTGDYDNAVKSAQQALEMYEACEGPDSAVVVDGLNYLAVVLQHSGKYVESQPLLRRAIRIEEAGKRRRMALVAARSSLAVSLFAEGRSDEATSIMERAIGEVMKEDSPPATVAIAWNNYARLLRQRGKLEEAFELLEQAIEIQKIEFGSWHPSVARTLGNQAAILLASGEVERAVDLFKSSLLLRERSLGKNHPEYAQGLFNLAIALRRANAWDEAQSVLSEAVVIVERCLDKNGEFLATILHNLGIVQMERGEFADAIAHLRRVVQIYQGMEHPSTKKSGKAMIVLGLALIEADKLSEAERHLHSTVDFLVSLNGPSDPMALDAMSLLGLCKFLAGQTTEGCSLASESHSRLLTSGKGSDAVARRVRERLQIVCGTP